MLSARVTSNLPTVRKRFNKFFKRFPNIVTMGLEQAGVQLKEIILDRTDRGLDFNKRKFVPYSQAYAEEKGNTVVNLHYNLKLNVIIQIDMYHFLVINLVEE